MCLLRPGDFMTEAASFDIMLLGLKDPTHAGRARYANVMERLTGRPGADIRPGAGRPTDPIFQSLDIDTARKVADALAEVGVLIEVRRSTEYASAVSEQVVDSTDCPRCGYVQPAGADECDRCGLVFAKFEREQVSGMQTSRQLEDALTRALQSREEWAQKAKAYLETHPLKEGSTDGFDNLVMRDEVSFLRLVSDEGPILMTSRRFIANVEQGYFSIPYEIVEDVTVGGGLVVKKSKVRLLLGFFVPIPAPVDNSKQFTWQLDKDSSFYKDVIMDWCFSRNFVCGGCGQRDLDYRLEDDEPRARCMHCATDHSIDLREAIAVPLTVE